MTGVGCENIDVLPDGMSGVAVAVIHSPTGTASSSGIWNCAEPVLSTSTEIDSK